MTLARLGIVGCGAVAQNFYVPALRALRGRLATLELFDKDRRHAGDMLGMVGFGRAAESLAELADRVDGVIVAVPNAQHFPVTEELLCRGRHVLVEKPACVHGSDARALAQAAERCNLVLCVNQTRRLYAPNAAIKRLVESQEFGRVLSVSLAEGEPFSWATVSGFYFTAGSRGVLLDRGAHLLDLVCWWLGAKPQVTDCRLDSFGGPEAFGTVHFRHGECEGEVRLSWLARQENRCTITFEGGQVATGTYDLRKLVIQRWGQRPETVRPRRAYRTNAAIATALVANFLDALSGIAAPLVPIAAVLDSLEMIDECYAAARPFSLPWYDRLIGGSEAGPLHASL